MQTVKELIQQTAIGWKTHLALLQCMNTSCLDKAPSLLPPQRAIPCRYSAERAGQYELTVKSSSDGEALAGSPYSLAVVPGDLSPSHCSARLTHGGQGLTAGGEAGVSVQAKDRYGNIVGHSHSYHHCPDIKLRIVLV